MASQLLIFALLCGGSLFAAVCFRLRFEQSLPLWCMSLVLLLFLFGVCGQLEAGFVLSLVLGLAAYPAALAGLFLRARRERPGTALRRFFTPLFFLYALVFLYFAALNRGRLVSGHDEFSHWADVVKAMVTVGALSSDPACHSTFASYPPAMGLFQYFFQKVNLLLHPGEGFCEWLLYSAWQSFAAAFFLPFFRRLELRRPYSWLLLAAVFLAPLSLFPRFYSDLLIDPFLGLAAAAGLALILVEDEPEAWSRLWLFLCAAILTLSKSVGLLLALFLLLAWLLWEYREGGLLRKGRKRALLLCAAGAASVLLPWLLWKLSLRVQGAPVAFDGKLDPRILLAVLTGRDGSWRSVLLDGYYNTLISGAGSLQLLGREMTWLFSFAFLLFLLLAVLKLRTAAAPEKKGLCRGLFALAAVELVVYLAGMLLTYMFKFSEYEALQLADLSRYLAVPLLMLWLTVLLGLVGSLHRLSLDRSLVAAGLLCLVLATVSGEAVQSLASRESVARGQELRGEYEEMYAQFCALETGPQQRIYLISQGDSGMDYQVLHYTFRPHRIGMGPSWSLGEPFYEGDLWTRACSPEQWRQELWENYDYVLLYRLNDYFTEHYSGLFAEPEEIRERAVYAVDRESGLLRLCQ